MKESLWDRLKQRKLFQWALAYAAGAWALLESVDLVGGQFGWPTRLLQSITILVAMGFFVVLVLAWYHGEKGQQTVSGPELLLIAGLLGIAGGLMAILAQPSEEEAGTETAGFVSPTSLGPASVAVLPFTGSSATEEDQTDFFVDGIHSEILTQLSKIASLEVIGRASVMRFADSEEPIQSIGAQLGVASLLEGTVLRAGERVRMNVRLLDAGSGREMWAEAYERELTVEQLFAIQADIAVRIASALQATLSAGLGERIADRPTDSLAAYDHYLRGHGYWGRGLRDQAIEAYQLAVSEDPHFAPAWATLSSGLFSRYFTTGIRNLEDREKAFHALQQAQSLAPEAAATHMAIGYSHQYGSDWPMALDSAAEQFARVIELQPSSVGPILALGRVRRHQGRWEDALALFERAMALDPLAGGPPAHLGETHRNLRSLDQAVRYLDRAIALGRNPSFRQKVLLRLISVTDTFGARLLIDEAPPSIQPSQVDEWRRRLAYFRRDVPALMALVDVPFDSASFAYEALRYRWLVRLQRLREDPGREQVYADSLEVAEKHRLRDYMDGGALLGLVAYRRADLAAAHALLGKEEEALREARIAQELFPVEADYWNADYVYYQIARMHTFLGNTEGAIDELGRVLALPSDNVSPGTLRLDRDFDPLREHPRFQALLEDPPSVN